MKREVELSLVPRIEKSLTDNKCPTTELEISNMLKAYIHISTYL